MININVISNNKVCKVKSKIHKIQNGGSILQQIKPFIVFETIIGVNRLFLYDCQKWVRRLSFVYNILMVILSVTVLIVGEIFSTTLFMFKVIMVIEYLLLALVAVLQRRELRKFLLSLQSFDESLNIQNDIFFKIATPFSYLLIVATLLYNVIDVFSIVLTYPFKALSFSLYAAYLGFIVHECETIFLCILLLMVFKRIGVMRAHIAKLFSVEPEIGKNCTKIKCLEEKLKELSKKIELDITSLHRAYDALHQCAEQLNVILRIPIIIMLIASAVSMIMIMRNMILLVNINLQDLSYFKISNFLTAVGAGRCFRSIMFMILPCFYANISKKQVDFIRSMIYETLSTAEFDKVERRKLKAFYQLTCDCGFEYTVCGIASLDMSLPLRFLSVCVTYLIIVVQFSKFIS